MRTHPYYTRKNYLCLLYLINGVFTLFYTVKLDNTRWHKVWIWVFYEICICVYCKSKDDLWPSSKTDWVFSYYFPSFESFLNRRLLKTDLNAHEEFPGMSICYSTSKKSTWSPFLNLFSFKSLTNLAALSYGVSSCSFVFIFSNELRMFGCVDDDVITSWTIAVSKGPTK